MTEPSKMETLLAFFSRHLRTCSSEAFPLTVESEGSTLRQRCSCGAEMTVTLDLVEASAALHVLKSDDRFETAMQQALKRTLH